METFSKAFERFQDYLQQNYLNLIFILVYVIVAFLLIQLIQRKVKSRLVRKSPNHVTANFTSQMVGFLLKATLVFSALYLLGLSSFTNKLLAGAGLLTFVVGFALKDIGENFLAGIILAFKSPFKLDDLIEVNGIIGHVKDINMRDTLVKTPDGKDVFLPNSIILKNPLYNYTIDGFLRYDFTVGIAYENDPNEAIQIVRSTINQIEGVLGGDKEASISVDELGTNSINIHVSFWIDTFASTKRSIHNSIRSEVITQVTKALLAKGVSLPASIVELKNYEAYGAFKLDKSN